MEISSETDPVPGHDVRERIRELFLGPRPAFYSLGPIKRGLATELGTKVAAPAFANAAGLPGAWGCESRPVVDLFGFAQSNATIFEILAEARNLACPPLVSLDGRELLPSTIMQSRNLCFCVLKHAVVSSKSNLILCEGYALLDAQAHELAAIGLQLDVDPPVIAYENGIACMLRPLDAEPELRFEAAISLLGVHSYAFGHWIAEFLPKLWACMGRPGFARTPILVDAQMPIQHRQAIHFFVGPDHPVVVIPPGMRVAVDALWTATMPAYFPVGRVPDAGRSTSSWTLPVDPDAFLGLFRRGMRGVSLELPRTSLPSRIYFSRGADLHRRLINASVIEAQLLDRGFANVDFASLPFAEQVSFVRNAEVAVGPDGSAFFTTIFGKPDLKILCLCNPAFDDFQMYNAISHSLGHEFRVATGDFEGPGSAYRTHGNFAVEVESGSLDEFLAQRKAEARTAR